MARITNYLFTPQLVDVFSWRLRHPISSLVPSSSGNIEEEEQQNTNFVCSGVFPFSQISLQQTPNLNSFPITPRAVTQNYLCSILYLPEQTKAWECFQQRGEEASWVDRDASWHLLFPSPCHTTKGAEGHDTKTWIGYSQSVTDHLRMYYTLLPKHDQKP